MKKALLYTENLLFKSKVSAMLSELKLELVAISATADTRALLREHQPIIIIYDLSRNGLRAVNQIRELRNIETGFGGVILGIGPHVETELLQSAEHAGADIVIPNSVFAARGGRIIEAALENS